MISRIEFLSAARRGAVTLAVAAAFVLAGCAGSRGGPIPYDVQGFGAPDAPAADALGADYRIAPHDTLRVSVFQVEALTGEYQVDLQGNIAMPLIGSVPAVGLTTAELQQSLEQRLGERYLANPDVTVGIHASTQRVVTIDGSVRRPGPIDIRGQMTLMQAVATAGGPDDNANPRRVAIFRQVGGQRMAAAFDLVSIRRGETQDPPVYRGDIVVVDGSRIRAMQRELLNSLPLFTLFRPF
ncbi:MAG: polysaccharide biosynthesis/export family protein [Sphingosinicella sp.]